MSTIVASDHREVSRVSPDTMSPLNNDVLYEVVHNQFKELEPTVASATHLASTPC